MSVSLQVFKEAPNWGSVAGVGRRGEGRWRVIWRELTVGVAGWAPCWGGFTALISYQYVWCRDALHRWLQCGWQEKGGGGGGLGRVCCWTKNRPDWFDVRTQLTANTIVADTNIPIQALIQRHFFRYTLLPLSLSPQLDLATVFEFHLSILSTL